METTSNTSIIQIPAEDDSPSILIDTVNMYLKVKGPSYPEDALESYSPVLDWLKTASNSPIKKLKAEFDFAILSSASNKMVYEILLKIEALFKLGFEVVVNWYYEEFDEDLFEEGRSYKEVMVYPFNIIAK